MIDLWKLIPVTKIKNNYNVFFSGWNYRPKNGKFLASIIETNFYPKSSKL